jgi:hypothetical protein
MVGISMKLRMNKILLPTLLAVAAVYAADEPAVKEGLWSVHRVTTDNPGNKKSVSNRSICRDHAYDAAVRARASAMMAKTCKINTFSGSGSKYTSESECVQMGSTMHTKGTMTLDGTTVTHTEETTTFTPPMEGVAETTMITDQKYVGACPAGMQPGDTMDADGKISHRRR